ncbi:MAG: NAD(P)-dependent oxidoreductase [Chloroflexota bacterium]
MPYAVHLGYTPDGAPLAHLQANLNSDIMLTYGTEIPDEPQYNILVSGRPPIELLEASPHIEAILIPFAGLPTVTRDRMTDYPDIAIHNVHYNAPPTAEMALALLMATARRLIPSDRDFRQHDWTPRYQPYPSVILRGKRALILGYGAIGQYLADILRAMGMTVTGIRRRHHDAEAGIYPPEKLHDLLPTADVLIVAVPGTPDTEGMIAERELSLLPEGAIVVNIGRASVIDQHALYDALKSEHLHGAASDVWYHYPPDKESQTHTPPADVPFHELDNMVMSPHRAGGGRNLEIELMRMDAIATSLNTWVETGTLPHRVSLELGY